MSLCLIHLKKRGVFQHVLFASTEDMLGFNLPGLTEVCHQFQKNAVTLEHPETDRFLRVHVFF